MSSPRICIVTIHGIGFEQPPIYLPGEAYPEIAGYADDLHNNLSKYLNKDKKLLSDDPNRQREFAGQNGAIYVESVWPTATPEMIPSQEAGRSRLGTWDAEHPLRVHPIMVDGSPAPLYEAGSRITHVALVYSKEESVDPHLGAGVTAIATALTSLGHYGHIANLAHTFLLDIQQIKQSQTKPTPSLCIRQDAGSLNKTVPHGFMGILRQFENDVAAYVCRNELRERIRGFVLDALLRLACREDVDEIVINAHSNGTVITFDVLCQLPPYAAKKIAAFITAGSPLRKYTKLFNWGRHIAMYPPIKQWVNFFDPRDLVADPLYTPADWLVGDADPIEQIRYQAPDPETGNFTLDAVEAYLYQTLDPDTGQISNIPIQDKSVDNLKYSVGGGLLAHNYWDNESQFIIPVSNLLEALSAGKDRS